VDTGAFLWFEANMDSYCFIDVICLHDD